MYTYVIIDDEPLIRRGTKKKLEPLSHLLTCCGEASDGREGLELVRQLKPDIVILDMQMREYPKVCVNLQTDVR